MILTAAAIIALRRKQGLGPERPYEAPELPGLPPLG
jgi:hypothetical protein